MSFVILLPEKLGTAATDLASLGSTLNTANAAAAVQTTGLLAAAEDEVSAGHCGAVLRSRPELSGAQRAGGGVP